MTTQTPDSSETRKRQLAGFLRIGRNHKSDLEMLPALADLENYVETAVQQASKALLEAELGQFEILGLNTAEEIKECIRNDIASYSEHPHEQ